MPHRIVSLIASATEIVCALGFERELVGRSHECDHPPGVARLPTCSSSKVKVEASSRAIDDQVQAIVRDGLSVYSVDPALLDRLAPTVIVTQTQCEVCAVSLRDVERAVCDLVRSQPAIVSLEPMALGDVWSDIRAVAAALGEP
ncbi:MAG: cobalamin-binding protein, partial [Gammaproteobacteria bacterium]|nr:cobalamin-binding protein [Gammaproteobacteria bacterium]